MGVYIKGMEMPQGCDDCPMQIISNDGLYKLCWVSINFCRETDCPLVEVKEPHGRLIDEDELSIEEDVYNQILVIEASTVIEAEGE